MRNTETRAGIVAKSDAAGTFPIAGRLAVKVRFVEPFDAWSAQ